MKFSIVTTFYNNTLEEIERIKDSILNQTYTKWEWIISDDFSNYDISGVEYIKSLTKLDKRIKYIEQKSKKEIFWNPQTYATGDYVMLVGADDSIYPKTLEIFNYYFIKYPKLILITSESNIYVNNSIIASTFLEYLKFGSLYDKCNFYPNRDFSNGWLDIGVPLTWRNIPIDFNSEFNLDNRSIVNDYLIHTKLEELGNFLHLPRVFYNCNIRRNSVSRMIDDDNSYLIHDNKEINKIIGLRRKNKEIKSHLSLYNSIISESKAFYYSNLNNEKTCQDVSFISQKLTSIKMKKIKKLYLDHNIYFNHISDNIDYYIFYIDKGDNIDNFGEFYNNIKKYKQLIIFCNFITDDEKNKINTILDSGYGWFDFFGLYVIFK